MLELHRELTSLVPNHSGAAVAVIEIGAEADHAISTGIIGGNPS